MYYHPLSISYANSNSYCLLLRAVWQALRYLLTDLMRTVALFLSSLGKWRNQGSGNLGGEDLTLFWNSRNQKKETLTRPGQEWPRGRGTHSWPKTKHSSIQQTNMGWKGLCCVADFLSFLDTVVAFVRMASEILWGLPLRVSHQFQPGLPGMRPCGAGAAETRRAASSWGCPVSQWSLALGFPRTALRPCSSPHSPLRPRPLSVQQWASVHDPSTTEDGKWSRRD